MSRGRPALTRVKKYAYNGELHTIRVWAELYNLNPTTLRFRIERSGWPIEKALTEPVLERPEPVAKPVKNNKLCTNKCKTCIYGSASSHYVTCNYILEELHRRPCPAGACTVYKRGKKKPNNDAMIIPKEARR